MTNNNWCTWEKFLEAFAEERQALDQATEEYIDERLVHYGMWMCRQCKALMPVERDHCKRCDCGRHLDELAIAADKIKIIPLEKSKSSLKRKAHGS
jgi:ribosomal protein L40E